jgi:large subunit ribosomal protein L15
LRYEPDYFGKTGFTSPKSLRQRVQVINVGKLDQMAKLSTETKDDKPLVDLEKLGYTKLLGTGRVTSPIIVKVPAASKSAADKIKGAGGQVLPGAEKQESSG